MGIKIHEGTGVGEITKVPKNCCQCGCNYTNIALPVKNDGDHPRYGKQKYLPDTSGRELCWKCYEKISGYREFVK